MRTVFKYEVPIDDHVTLSMPVGAELLCFANQRDVPTLWALVDPGAAMVERRFLLVGTGHPVGGEILRHVGTAQFRGGALVFHLFEILVGKGG
jgi:hypothetical protein